MNKQKSMHDKNLRTILWSPVPILCFSLLELDVNFDEC